MRARFRAAALPTHARMLILHPLGAHALLQPPQVEAPAALNLTTDEVLFARVAVVIASADDPAAARRPAMAPFMTNALALRDRLLIGW